MNKTYKFRLYPTKDNEQKLLWTLNKCRFVYNYLLEQKNNTGMNRFQLQSLIPLLKKEIPDLTGVYSQTLCYENFKLHLNIFSLYRYKKNGNKVGKLRFKVKSRFRTFTYSQKGFKIVQHETRYDTLHLSKIGNIPMLMHRKIEGKIKFITIKYNKSGKWFASIITEEDKIKHTKNKKSIGIDVGLDNYVYDSDNNRIDHPRCLDNSLKKLRKVQRRLSRKKKHSKNKNKQKVKVARAYEKVTNQRDDFLHKLSRQYIDNYGIIAVEDLKVANMTRNRYLSRSIMDASWSRFIKMLEYKAESAGVQVMKVEARNTTQKCSQCGNIVKKSLAVRTHKCSCGFVADRDYNSALNILRQGLSEVTPVETEPLLLNSQGQVQSLKQEALAEV